MTRSHADLLGLEGHNLVNGNDLHLHFPAGAVEKVTQQSLFGTVEKVLSTEHR